ncbi:MAG: hypothetical protein FWD28_01465 [Treponema sp.]|nr:hypothetical protein [Treponema sp.]
MKHKTVFLALIVLQYFAFANDTELLNEYKLLYLDLSNVDTMGYKSHFNNLNNRAGEDINFSQGALIHTGILTDLAIIGEGFLKIRLDNDIAGYTRAGDFRIDANGNFVTPQGYFLYDNINLPGLFLLETLRITRYGRVFIRIAEGSRREEIREIEAGQIKIHRVPSDLLIRYSDTIFIIKPGAEYTEEREEKIEFTSLVDEISYELNSPRIFPQCLEHSNVHYLPVVLRMYYILSVIGDGYISNIEFKKEILKVIFDNIVNSTRQEDILLYTKTILPYLRFDY